MPLSIYTDELRLKIQDNGEIPSLMVSGMRYICKNLNLGSDFLSSL